MVEERMGAWEKRRNRIQTVQIARRLGRLRLRRAVISFEEAFLVYLGCLLALVRLGLFRSGRRWKLSWVVSIFRLQVRRLVCALRHPNLSSTLALSDRVLYTHVIRETLKALVSFMREPSLFPVAFFILFAFIFTFDVLDALVARGTVPVEHVRSTRRARFGTVSCASQRRTLLPVARSLGPRVCE